MSEYNSAGIFIEEVASSAQTIEAVSTSTMAVVGWTPKGPVDDATLVTSPQSFERIFGGNTRDSLVPLSVSAYFNNGGTRAYVVRVAPSDAVASSVAIPGVVTAEAYGSGTGASPTTLTHTLSFKPTSGTVTVTWKKVGSDVSGEDPTFDPAEDGSELGPFVATLASLPTNDVITLHWTESAAAKTATITGTSTVGGTDAANLVSASIARATGVLTITFDTGHAPDTGSIAVDYKPIGATATVTDSAGTFTAAGTTGTISYTTGAVSLTWSGASVVPYNGCPVTVTYTGNQWTANAANVGTWGNGLKVRLKGNDNFFVYDVPTPGDTSAGTWTKYDLLVMLLNSDTGLYEVKETFEELVFTDASDAMYAPDVINDGSDFITLTDYNYLDVPSTFKGVSHTAESIGSPNGVLTTFTHTASYPTVVKRSLKVTYTVASTVKTAEADLDGIITGTDLDTTKTNSINWTTGEVTLNFSTAPDNATTLTMDYITTPTTSYVDYTFTGGLNGTLTTINQARVSLASALQADRKGLYALDRVDDMLQIIIPDFGGDAAVQGDMVDYCDNRRDCFAVLCTPRNFSAQNAVEWTRITFAKKSKYAAVYWPWVKVADPLSNGRPLTVPPVAHVAGIYARTDSTKNVSKAPAGTVDGALRGIIGLERNPDKGERDTVYPARINPLISTTQTGTCVWGCRTLSATNDALKWVNAVRLFIYVEKSVFNSTHYLVFESITPNLYNMIKTQLDSFLLNLYSTGHFAGATPRQAFSVVCDSSNNPAEVINAGQVVVDVAIAPNRPGEFIRFRFAQKSLS